MQPKKKDFIDALRGLAALYVLVFHFSLITTPKAVAPSWLAPITGIGGAGVTLFFVVSAFTLSLSMDVRSPDEKTPILNYFIRRYFRIAPLFYVWMAAYYVRDILVFDTVHPPSEIVLSLLFVLNFFPGHEQGYVWASWTLGVEMVFYVLFPLIFWYAKNLGKATALFFGACILRWAWHAAVPYLVNDSSVAQTYYNFSLLHHLPSFMIGVVAYRLCALLNFDAARKLGIGHFLIGGFAAAWLGICYGMYSVNFLDSLTFQAIAFGSLLLGLAVTAPAFIVNRVTCFYGKISYSVYLSHATILFFMSELFALIYAQNTNVTTSYALSLAMGLAVVTSVSYATYCLVELPGLNAGRALIRMRTALNSRLFARRTLEDVF